MPITRRIGRFNELATGVEAILAGRGLCADAAVVDRLLNEREQYVADLLGVTPRTALRSVPDDLPQRIAAEIIRDGLARPTRADVVGLTERRRQRANKGTHPEPL